jgi:flagellar protein FlgJ
MNNSALLPTTQPINIDTTRYTSQYDRLDNYNDINALQSIKYQSKSDKDGALDAAAKHFESIFVSMMVKSMRDAHKVFYVG